MPTNKTLPELVSKMRDVHQRQWHSTSDEVYGRPGFCAECGTEWPCDVVTLIAAIDSETKRD